MLDVVVHSRISVVVLVGVLRDFYVLRGLSKRLLGEVGVERLLEVAEP